MSKLVEVRRSALARCSSFSSPKWNGSTPGSPEFQSMFKRRSQIILNKGKITRLAMKMRLKTLTTTKTTTEEAMNKAMNEAEIDEVLNESIGEDLKNVIITGIVENMKNDPKIATKNGEGQGHVTEIITMAAIITGIKMTTKWNLRSI